MNAASRSKITKNMATRKKSDPADPADNPNPDPPDAAGEAEPPPEAEHPEPEAPPEKVVDKAEVEQLLRAGHRMHRKGDDPKNWVTMARVGGELAIAFALTDEMLHDLLGEDLVLLP